MLNTHVSSQSSTGLRSLSERKRILHFPIGSYYRGNQVGAAILDKEGISQSASPHSPPVSATLDPGWLKVLRCP